MGTVAALAAAGLGTGLAVAASGSGTGAPATSADAPGSPLYSYYALQALVPPGEHRQHH